jgi:hypothetical protein
MQAAFIIAILRDAAEIQPVLHIGPPPWRLRGRDVQEKAGIRVNVTGLADDCSLTASIAP